MNIGVDIRPLLEKERSGVGEYVYQLLNAIFNIDRKNHYFLFYNSFKKVDDLFPKEWRNYSNIHFCGFHWPNKIFNFTLKFFKWPKIDKMIAKVLLGRQNDFVHFKKSEVATPVASLGEKISIFFIPNLNFIALSRGVEKIITIHDLSFERYPKFFSWKRRLWHWFVNPRKLIRECDKVIAVSENTKNDLVELYKIPAEKIQVIYSGVVQSIINNQELRIKEIKEKYNLPEHFILFLGTLEPRKNIGGLIRAFEIFKKNFQFSIFNFKLVIVGPKGWCYKNILKRANQSPAHDDLKFINYISSEEKFAFYKLADLFVYLSFYEGFGFPPLEAALVGTPVIVSAASSMPEVMGEAALMVDPYNPVETAKIMAECLTNQKLRQRLIEKGKKQAAKFSWDNCACKVFELFNNRWSNSN